MTTTRGEGHATATGKGAFGRRINGSLIMPERDNNYDTLLCNSERWQPRRVHALDLAVSKIVLAKVRHYGYYSTNAIYSIHVRSRISVYSATSSIHIVR